MARLTKNNKVIRDELLAYAWENYKNRITMKNLAEIFQIDLPRVYQILRGGKDETKIAKGELYKLDNKINKVLDNNK